MEGTIKIAVRQVIGAGTPGQFEQDVWRDSYGEYLIQVQTFDREEKYLTWDSLRMTVPKAKINVQYKTGFAIGLYILGLQNKIPGVSTTLGQFITFENYRFEILSSHIHDPAAHTVAITYTTPPLALRGTVGPYLLLGNDAASADTFMIEMQQGMSIVHYEAA